ncbi:Pan3 Pseudokinase domain [Popillia japonica]|uniref:PAN2-PAN3 deadenylation complex subunit PAN3 n=1 Tax=Popillia japonica TaxID=7064 RepID=A0AAW1KNK2_POPJA
MMLINNNNFVLEQLMATDYNNDIQQSNEVVASIKGDVAYIKQEICNIKQELKLHTTKMNLNFDKIYDRLSAKKNCTCNCENAFIRQHNVTIPKEDLLKKYKFPLSSTADISKLDQEIRNNIEFKGQLVTALSRIGGTSGEEEGAKIAYKIIDFLFRSDVLVNYTWTGISRGKSSEKISFQMLEGIVTVLFEVISLADNRHTKQKNANVLKEGVLKHAKKRSLRKRASLFPIDQNEDAVETKEADHEEVRCQNTENLGADDDNILAYYQMDSEPKDVRERLNSLILKKIYDQQERESKEIKKEEEETQSGVVVKREVDCDTTEEKQPENVEHNKHYPKATSEYNIFFRNVSLNEILNEKKKALLRDPQVVNFLQNKIKFSDFCFEILQIFGMDHPVFLPYASANGVPQESKLATYMSRQNTSTPVVTNNLSQTFSKISIESPVSTKKVTPQSPEFVPGARVIASSTSASPNFFNSFAGLAGTAAGPGFPRLIDSPHSTSVSPHATPQSSPPPLAISNCSPIPHGAIEKPIGTVAVAYQENVGGTTYFYPTSSENSHTTNDTLNSISTNNSLSSAYQVYPGTPSHVNSIKFRGTNSSFFVSEDTRLDILGRNALTLAQSDPEHFPDLPHDVDSYHELCPLEPIPNNSLHKTHLGYQASMYKATNIKTGVRYCLRRIHGFRLQNTKCMTYVDQWKKLVHSNIVQLKEVFTTKAFGDNSMVFVYDFHPGSETLLSKHFSPDQLNGYTDPFATDPTAPRPYSHQKNNILRHQQSNKLPESLIWNYIIQLTSALRIIHSAGLACRSLDPTKIIITSGNRLRLSCLGVMDVIMNDTSASANPTAMIQHYQQDDLTALGKLVLALACKSTMAVQRENISTAIDVVTRTYTSDLRNLIMYLLALQSRRSVTDLMPMIGARFYTQLDNIQSRTDVLENEVSKEMENGRLFRLMVKLGTINERPEFNMDGTWSETGDRYMLKLFRDYVFHQVTEDGRPWLDMSHVVQCLNKLDTGVPEKVCLMSRDEQSILVVSYAELKHCLVQSFDEILSASMSTDNVT